MLIPHVSEGYHKPYTFNPVFHHLLLQVSSAALDLFEYGQQRAAERGLLLVDTKYEFGKDADGVIMLIDEIHTPDSSRYLDHDPRASSRHQAGIHGDVLMTAKLPPVCQLISYWQLLPS